MHKVPLKIKLPFKKDSSKNSPLNKSLDNFINKKKSEIFKNLNEKSSPGITIITCTHMQEYMDNIFNNYNRQSYAKKELIIVLNKNSLNLKVWKAKAKNYKNITVLQLDENISVGACMNYAVKKSRYDYIANFDHDDYYGAKYLNDFGVAFKKINADLYGKRTHYVFFEGNNLLALRHPNMANQYVTFLDGPTVVFKKKIFEKVKYIDSDFADCQLSFDSVKHGFKIYSINPYNFAYIRRIDKSNHTWQIEDNELIRKFCKVIGEVDNYQEYVDR